MSQNQELIQQINEVSAAIHKASMAGNAADYIILGVPNPLDYTVAVGTVTVHSKKFGPREVAASIIPGAK